MVLWKHPVANHLGAKVPDGGHKGTSLDVTDWLTRAQIVQLPQKLSLGVGQGPI